MRGLVSNEGVCKMKTALVVGLMVIGMCLTACATSTNFTVGPIQGQGHVAIHEWKEIAHKTEGALSNWSSETTVGFVTAGVGGSLVECEEISASIKVSWAKSD